MHIIALDGQGDTKRVGGMLLALNLLIEYRNLRGPGIQERMLRPHGILMIVLTYWPIQAFLFDLACIVSHKLMICEIQYSSLKTVRETVAPCSYSLDFTCHLVKLVVFLTFVVWICKMRSGRPYRSLKCLKSKQAAFPNVVAFSVLLKPN